MPKRKTLEEIQDRCYERWGDARWITAAEYRHSPTDYQPNRHILYVYYVCYCGYEDWARGSVFFRQTTKFGCYECGISGRDYVPRSISFSLDDRQDQLDAIWPDALLVLAVFRKDKHSWVGVRCLNCGYERNIRAGDLKNAANPCPACAPDMPLGERRVCDWLDSYNFNYRVHDCEVMPGYEVDFWLPEYRIMIEVDGDQHQNKSNGWYSERTQERDIDRELYAERNQIYFIRLPDDEPIEEELLWHFEAMDILTPD